MAKSRFTTEVIECIRAIPAGSVATYGGIAELAGNPRAARQVARVLHTFGEKEKLPWHRVINGQGGISLKPMAGYEEQRELLEREGVVFGHNDRVDLDRFRWIPESDELDFDIDELLFEP